MCGNVFHIILRGHTSLATSLSQIVCSLLRGQVVILRGQMFRTILRGQVFRTGLRGQVPCTGLRGQVLCTGLRGQVLCT